MKFDFFDYTGEICPVPVIKVIKLFLNMQSGDEIQVLVDDPAAVKSISDELAGQNTSVTVISYGSSWKLTIIKK